MTLDKLTVRRKLRQRNRVNDMIDWYFSEVVDKGYSGSNWDIAPHAKYETLDNAFGRMFIDKLKSADVALMCELFGISIQDFNSEPPRHVLEHMNRFYEQAQLEKFEKNTPSCRKDKWNTAMNMFDAMTKWSKVK